MKTNRWWVAATVCALTGLALWGAIFNSPASFARGEQAPALQAEDITICPLSPRQEQDAKTAFAEMMPIFTHPRCINCHGAVNPFAANGNHGGGRIDVPMRTTSTFDSALGRDIEIVVPDDPNASNAFGGCQNCHSGLKGWTIPDADKFFVGKDRPTLCSQMLIQTNQPSVFVAHLEHEGDYGLPHFIDEAFKGTRGLDENGQATYENLPGNNVFMPEPPPMSHAQFVDIGRKWTKPLDDGMDGFKGGNTCGCKPHQYSLSFVGDLGTKLDTGPLTGKKSSHVDFKIPITFKDDGSFTGEVSADRKIVTALVIGGIANCNGTATVKGEVWKVEGSRSSFRDWFDVKLTDTWPNPAQDSTVCAIPGAGSGGANFNPRAVPTGDISFSMKGLLDDKPNGMPNPLDVSKAPYATGMLTIKWVDDAP